MKNSTQFLLTLFAWILFAVGGFTFLRLEMESAVPNRHYELPTVASAPYKGTGDLNKISGEQVIGMIPPALEGNIFYISMALQLMRNRTLQQWICVECLMLLIS